MQKFTIDPEQIAKGPESANPQICIAGQDARHMGRVLRLKPGDPVSMTDGKGTDFSGSVIRIAPDTVEVEILGQQVSRTESGLDLTICCAMLKDKKMDCVIRELTQLGITSWVPFFSSRSVPTPDGKKLARRRERWQSIARESLKQCRRSCDVAIPFPCTFDGALAAAKDADYRIAFWEGALHPLVLDSQGQRAQALPQQKAVVLIGPEGGFTDQEIQQAESAGFESYTLGPRILRAETAAVTAAALVQYLLGDLGSGRQLS